MSDQASEDAVSLAELLETGIAALKGLIPLIWLQSKIPPIQFLIGGVVVLLATFLFTISPPHNPAEPPIIKPRVPVIGHLIGLLRSQVNYFSDLHTKSHLPIATLPIGHRKLYVIFDASLQQAALKARDMDAQSFMVDFVPRIFGIRQGTIDRLLGRDGVHPNIMADMEHVFKVALSGDNLNHLAGTTLGTMADTLNGIDEKTGLDVPNLFLWIQGLVGRATAKALWGKEHNPYRDEDVLDAQWEFESNMGPLVLGVLPRLIARKAYLARKKIQSALIPYYRSSFDQRDASVSEFVRARSQLLRKYDLPVDELAKNEVSITLVATTNALSTLYWCIAETWVRPDVLAEIRTEAWRAVVAPLLEKQQSEDGDTATKDSTSTNLAPGNISEITITAGPSLESKCPLLASCFRESIRLASQIVTARRVLKDTLISGADKRTYLLKAETNVMMPAKVVHRDVATWGDDAEEFNARRFLAIQGQGVRFENSTGNTEADRQQRNMKAAFVPFGGGKHLCPGRHFAFTENLAFMAALALGFEIDGLQRERLRMGDSKRGETAKPLPGMEGGPVALRKRRGWEGVKWEFVC
ncbi:cytochrome P450 [Bombardia bombarda]|uniref:Cytochrome P450 n=1 Tax=Bombardia bombarda TaxID=252184 RepID=A0AA39XB70_9PEZI|nr:cytochrome P450 [Bombardia bombarda]